MLHKNAFKKFIRIQKFSTYYDDLAVFLSRKCVFIENPKLINYGSCNENYELAY